jgi:hypothetical protein
MFLFFNKKRIIVIVIFKILYENKLHLSEVHNRGRENNLSLFANEINTSLSIMQHKRLLLFTTKVSHLYRQALYPFLFQ